MKPVENEYVVTGVGVTAIEPQRIGGVVDEVHIGGTENAIRARVVNIPLELLCNDPHDHRILVDRVRGNPPGPGGNREEN